MTDRDDFTNDPTVKREMAVHEAREAIERLYQTIQPQDAHWIATTAIIDADRNERARRRQANGNT